MEKQGNSILNLIYKTFRDRSNLNHFCHDTAFLNLLPIPNGEYAFVFRAFTINTDVGYLKLYLKITKWINCEQTLWNNRLFYISICLSLSPIIKLICSTSVKRNSNFRNSIKTYVSVAYVSVDLYFWVFNWSKVRYSLHYWLKCWRQ